MDHVPHHTCSEGTGAGTHGRRPANPLLIPNPDTLSLQAPKLAGTLIGLIPFFSLPTAGSLSTTSSVGKTRMADGSKTSAMSTRRPAVLEDHPNSGPPGDDDQYGAFPISDVLAIEDAINTAIERFLGLLALSTRAENEVRGCCSKMSRRTDWEPVGLHDGLAATQLVREGQGTENSPPKFTSSDSLRSI